jgi:hypothetical protein
MRVTPPEVVLAQTAVSRDMARKVVESFPAPARWSSLTVAEVTPASYSFALLYRPGSASGPEIEADARSVVRQMLLQLAMAGHHPNDERTIIRVSARLGAPDGTPVGDLGTARFDAARDRIVFDPPGPDRGPVIGGQ